MTVDVGSQIDLGKFFGGSLSQRKHLVTHWQNPNLSEMVSFSHEVSITQELLI